jgi:hypothetical protein
MTAPAKSAMTRFVKILPAILALPLCAQAAAPQMFKCKDAAGRITYAGKECTELGLSSAGEVKGRTSVTPALKVPLRAPPPVPDAADKVAAPPSQSSEGAPVIPARRCFTVKTAKGTAERCNDAPE